MQAGDRQRDVADGIAVFRDRKGREAVFIKADVFCAVVAAVQTVAFDRVFGLRSERGNAGIVRAGDKKDLFRQMI